MAGFGVGAFTIQPWLNASAYNQEFPQSDHLGRVCEGVVWEPLELKTRPSDESNTIATLKGDDVVERLREVIGGQHTWHRSRRWIETPDGYIWSPVVQPVKNRPNPETAAWAKENLGEGFWAEVTVPMVDVELINRQPVAPWLNYYTQRNIPPKFYYSQILWIDDVKQSENNGTLLRVNEKYGNPGDLFWAPAEAFRPIAPDEFTPIHPEAEEKHVVVRLDDQSLSCFEGNREVYYCRVSSGLNPSGIERDKYLTPLGNFPIWGKYISVQMSGNAGGGWDIPGVGWASYFFKDGQAIHSTHWHNIFGEENSRGCVNVAPADARWIFCWSLPSVDYTPGTRTIQGYSGTTMINVVEA